MEGKDYGVSTGYYTSIVVVDTTFDEAVQRGMITYRVMIAKPCLISSRIALEAEVVSTFSSFILVVSNTVRVVLVAMAGAVVE